MPKPSPFKQDSATRTSSNILRNSRQTFGWAILLLATFRAGVGVGRRVERAKTTAVVPSAIPGTVIHLSDVPIRNTVHKDQDSGESIQKQQLLEPFVVPNLSGIAVATLVGRQQVEEHEHRSMHEFFYVLSGNGVFAINGEDHEVRPGTLLHLAPHEPHRISVAAKEDGADTDSRSSLQMFYFGVTVGD